MCSEFLHLWLYFNFFSEQACSVCPLLHLCGALAQKVPDTNISSQYSFISPTINEHNCWHFRLLILERFTLSHVMRILTFFICKNKGADQFRGNREANQRLCFRYRDSIILLHSESEISSLKLSSLAVQPSLCRK